MFLIDTALPPPENPVTVEDLYRRWATASGFLYPSNLYWDLTVCHANRTFAGSTVWGYYEAVPSPGYTPDPGLHLLIGFISSWGIPSDEHTRGVLDQFIPLESEAEIDAYRTEIYPPLPYTLDQVADILAHSLASIKTLSTGGGPLGTDNCYGEEPWRPGLAQPSAGICHYPVARGSGDGTGGIASWSDCVADFKFCRSQAESALEAAKATCDSNRFYGDLTILGCAALGPVGYIPCTIAAGGLVAEA